MNGPDQNRVQQLLAELSAYVKSGQISKSQILALFEEEKPAEPEHRRINLQQLFYLLGALIVIVGIVVFIAQFWQDMGQLAKVFITLGPAIAAYSAGYYFFQQEKSKGLGLTFLIISSAIYPLGIGTTLDLVGISAIKMAGLTIISTVLFIIYFVSYFALKTWVFLPFAILAGSSAFVTFTNLLVENAVSPAHFNEYRALILGLVYISLGYYFSLTGKKSLVGILYFFGFAAFLGASLALIGFKPKINLFWQLIYPFLLVVTFYLSVLLQSRAILIAGTIFTIGEIGKLTAEYFSDSLGWPIALIIAGLVVMGVGYLSFEVNKRFLQTSKGEAGQGGIPPRTRSIPIFILVFLIIGLTAVGTLLYLNRTVKTSSSGKKLTTVERRQVQAKDSGIKNDVGQIATALQAYYTTPGKGQYPTSLNDLVTSGDLRIIPTMPSGETYEYLRCADGKEAVVFAKLEETGTYWVWSSASGRALDIGSSLSPSTTCVYGL